jgi:branched-chain amino acid transport system permease protein
MEILPQILLNGLIAASLYGLIALGFNMIYGTVKFFDLAYGSVLVLSGYFVFLFSKWFGFSLVSAIFLSISLCGLFGILCWDGVYKSLTQRKASNMMFLIGSLGIFTIVQACIAMIFTSQFQTIATEIAPVIKLSNILVLTRIQLISIILFAVTSVLLWLFLFKTRIGKAMRATADDKEVSEIIGINTQKITRIVFFLGSIIGSFAGILIAFDTGLEPTMGFGLLLKGIVAAIIGGVGNVWGGVVGALFLGLVENIGIWQLSAQWKDIIVFSVLILVLLFKPKGILAT